MIVAPGATSVSVTFRVFDDSGLPASGLVAATLPSIYWAPSGGDGTLITLSDLATVGAAWSSGGVHEKAGTAAAYRLCVPDAAFASADTITIYGEASGKRVVCESIVVANVPADLQTIKTQTVTCGAAVTIEPFVGTATAAIAVDGSGHVTAGTVAGNVGGSVVGDVEGKVLGGGASALTGTGVRAVDASGNALATAATALSTAQWTNARAGYLDNLNVGGAVASHADIVAINQSASKHLLLVTVGQYEPGETYTVEMRTFAAADGSAVNADSTPTLTATGQVSGSLSANLSIASNPATGVYRWTYTPGATPTLEQIRFDGSATISAATFTLSCYSQTIDEATAVFTATDQSHLTSIFNKLPTNAIADETVLAAAIAACQQAGAAVTLPTIPANWIDAAGIAAGALDGKGDWLLATSYGTTSFTESLPAVGAAMTEAQLLYEIRSLLAADSVSSSTLSTDTVAGTAKATYTLTLDGSGNPTGITRAT